jgi:peptidoglycan/xylan/chitin deacetylase (PgdA/CDA1 family)
MNKRSLYGVVGRMLFFHRKPEIRILMYHRVNPGRDISDMHITVTPRAFREQMQWLASKQWKVIPLSEAFRQINNKSIENPKQAVITFDDGYEDNYTHALPVLKAFCFPATIFLASGKIEVNPEFLNPDQISYMQGQKITFGGHTFSHPDLTGISTEKAWEEIYLSKQKLEKMLKSTVDTFAYPYGRFNAVHCHQLKNAGYQTAVTVAPGGNGGNENRFMLKRTEIANQDTIFDFANKLKGGFDWIHRYVQRNHGLYPVPQKRGRENERFNR